MTLPRQCLSTAPKCLTVAPGNASNSWSTSNLTQSFCIGGKVIQNWYYRYDTCDEKWIGQYLGPDYWLCSCILDPLYQCFPEQENNVCFTILICLAILQAITAVTGIIMNTFVTFFFIKDPSIRKRIPNILVFSQAIVDLNNCLTYGLPNAVNLFRATVQRQQVKYQYILSLSTATLTVSSSIFIFTLIAAERYLSVTKPLWHKATVCKKHIWITILISWILSFTLAGIRVYTTLVRQSHVYVYDIFYLVFLLCMSVILIFIVTVLFILTFLAARRSLSCAPSESTDFELIVKQKVRLTKMFLLMFIAFIFSFVPIPFIMVKGGHYQCVLMQILLLPICLTSVFNPGLILYLKKEFRIRKKQDKGDIHHSIEMSSVIPTRVDSADDISQKSQE